MRILLIITAISISNILSAQNKPGTTAKKKDRFAISVSYSNMRTDGILGDGELFSDGGKDDIIDLGDMTHLYGSVALDAHPQNVFPVSAIVAHGKRHHPHLSGFNASAAYRLLKSISIKLDVAAYSRGSDVNLVSVLTSAPYRSNMILPLQSSYPANTTRTLIALGGGRFSTEQKHHSFMGGVEFRNNLSDKKLRPFAQAMAGVAIQSVRFKDFTQREMGMFGSQKFTNTGFAMAIGGGIDVQLSKRVDLRAFQIDYHPVQITEQEMLAFKQPLTNMGLADNLSFQNLSTATIYSNNEIRSRNRLQHNIRLGIGVVFH